MSNSLASTFLDVPSLALPRHIQEAGQQGAVVTLTQYLQRTNSQQVLNGAPIQQETRSTSESPGAVQSWRKDCCRRIWWGK